MNPREMRDDLIIRLAYRLSEYHKVDHTTLKQENCATCLALWEAQQITQKDSHE